MEGRNKRRYYPIVDRSLQYRFLAHVLTYCAAVVLFLGVALFVPDILDIMNEDLGLGIRAHAAERMLTLHYRVWPAVIALLCVFGLHSIRIFHRLIGPLYRFRMVFEQVGKGSLDARVKLRKKDYLHREEEAFNDMMEVIQLKWDDFQYTLEKGQASLRELQESMTEVVGLREKDLVLLQSHRDRLEDLSEQLRYFREDKKKEQK